MFLSEQCHWIVRATRCHIWVRDNSISDEKETLIWVYSYNPQPAAFNSALIACLPLGLWGRARLLMVRKDYRAFYKATVQSLSMLGPDLPCTDGCFIPRFLLITLTHCSVCNSNKLIGSPQWAWRNLLVCHWILGGEGGLCLLRKRNSSHTSQVPLLSHFSFPFSPGALVSSGSLYLFHLRPWAWPITAKLEGVPSHCLLLAIWLLYSSLCRLLFQKFVPILFSRLPNVSQWCFPTRLHLYTCSHLYLKQPPCPSEYTEKCRFEPTRSNSRAHSFNLPLLLYF